MGLNPQVNEESPGPMPPTTHNKATLTVTLSDSRRQSPAEIGITKIPLSRHKKEDLVRVLAFN